MNAIVVAETIRRRFASILFVGVALAAVLSGVMSGHFQPASVWSVMIYILAVAVGAEVLGPEFSSGTLQLILTKPVNRSVYVLSRVAGAVLTVWIVGAACLVAEVLTRYYMGTERNVPRVLVEGLNLAVEVLLICSLLAFFGSFLRAYFNAAAFVVSQVILNLIMSALLTVRSVSGGFFGWVGKVVTNNPWIISFVGWLSDTLFPDRPGQLDWPWIVRMTSNAALLLIAACLIYRRREVPYGAD